MRTHCHTLILTTLLTAFAAHASQTDIGIEYRLPDGWMTRTTGPGNWASFTTADAWKRPGGLPSEWFGLGLQAGVPGIEDPLLLMRLVTLPYYGRQSKVLGTEKVDVGGRAAKLVYFSEPDVDRRGTTEPFAGAVILGEFPKGGVFAVFGIGPKDRIPARVPALREIAASVNHPAGGFPILKASSRIDAIRSRISGKELELLKPGFAMRLRLYNDSTSEMLAGDPSSGPPFPGSWSLQQQGAVVYLMNGTSRFYDLLTAVEKTDGSIEIEGIRANLIPLTASSAPTAVSAPKAAQPVQTQPPPAAAPVTMTSGKLSFPLPADWKLTPAGQRGTLMIPPDATFDANKYLEQAYYAGMIWGARNLADPALPALVRELLTSLSRVETSEKSLQKTAERPLGVNSGAAKAVAQEYKLTTALNESIALRAYLVELPSGGVAAVLASTFPEVLKRHEKTLEAAAIELRHADGGDAPAVTGPGADTYLKLIRGKNLAHGSTGRIPLYADGSMLYSTNGAAVDAVANMKKGSWRFLAHSDRGVLFITDPSGTLTTRILELREGKITVNGQAAFISPLINPR